MPKWECEMTFDEGNAKVSATIEEVVGGYTLDSHIFARNPDGVDARWDYTSRLPTKLAAEMHLKEQVRKHGLDPDGILFVREQP